MANDKRFIVKNGLDNNNKSIINITDPTSAQDAATKSYVDAQLSNIAGYTSWYISDGTNLEQILDGNMLTVTGTGASTVSYNAATNTLTVNSTDSNTTYTAGTGLSLVGTQFSHSDTSTQVSVNGSGRTYIQDITLDGFGHVTGIATATETVVNTTYSAGTGLSLVGTTFNVSSSPTWTTGRTITLTGDVTGASAAWDGSGNISFVTTIADDSHNHLISNVDGLQTALDTKLNTSSYTAADVLAKIKTVDGAGSGLDADLLDGQSSAYYTGYTDTAISNLIATAPTTLDTLNELAAALGDDPNFATTVTNSIATKLNTSSYTAADVLAKIKTVDGAGSGLDADLLDGQSSAYYYSPVNAPDPTLTLAGDATGSATFTNLGNATLTVAIADDSHNHIIGNVDGLQTALDGKADDTTIIATGSGLTGGGDLTANRTISHADTSTQASVDNSDGTVIQDITLDTYGHLTGINSVNLDGRYYTETEINTQLTNGTVNKINDQWSNQTGNLTGFVNDGGGNLGLRFNASPGGANTLVENGIAYELDVSNDISGGDFCILKGSTSTGTAGETITWTDAFRIEGTDSYLYSYGQKIFSDGYHPNADKLTTARNIALSGDVTGSATFDGSANISITATVADDSHGHSFNNLLNKTGGTGNYTTTGTFTGATFNATTTAGGGFQGIDADSITAPSFTWTADLNTGIYHPAADQLGITTGGVARGIFSATGLAVTGAITVTGTVDGRDIAADGTKLNTIETGATADQTAAEILAALITVDGAGSGLDADLFDGLTSGAFLRSNATDTATGVITFSNATAATSKTSGAVIVTGGVGVGGDVWATNFMGTSSAAKYSDLAERYETDAVNAAGTIMVFGGDKEVTPSTTYAQTKIAGVISTDPAYMMNSDAGSDETHPYIALQGRVPCKVLGKVRKGDIIVTSEYKGVGQSWLNEESDPRMTAYVGIAIEDKDTDGEGLVEVKVGK